MTFKNIIIFLAIFLVVLWLQHNDDLKYKKDKREKLYDIIKLPLFIGCIVILLQNLDLNLDCSKFFISINNLIPNKIISNNIVLNDVFTEQPDF